MKLVIDTSTGDLNLSIWSSSAEELIAYAVYPKGRGELLGDWVPEVLAEHQIELSDIEAVLVGIGPGSFTGLRTGIAFAQGLCALGRPLYQVSTLELLGGWSSESRLVAIPARPGLWYLGYYSIEGTSQNKEWMGTQEEILSIQANAYIGDSSFLEIVPASVTNQLNWQTQSWMEESSWNPKPFFGDAYLSSSQLGVKPNYIQAPSAEVILKAKKKPQ